MPYHLSVLDQSPIAAGRTAADAIRDTLDLAAHADALGYHRYWLAEHHASPGLAGVAPEALIGPVAQATRRIRVGSGGIMLPHYSPFKVAETFRLLSALAPGRIDLGLGRAPGSDQRTALALRQDRSRGFGAEDFVAQLRELMAYLDADGFADDHPFAALRETLPTGGGSPDLWLLGSSPDSARLAGTLGLRYCVADFINADGADLARLYRDSFRAGDVAEPTVAAAVWTIAAETAEQAQRLAGPSIMMFAHLVRGRLIAVPSADAAATWLAENPQAQLSGGRRRLVLGTPREVRGALDRVAEDYGAAELLLVNILSDHAARRRSYALVAAEYGLAMLEEAA